MVWFVPAGWLAYTYTAPGGDLSTWARPQLAFNRTLTIRSRGRRRHRSARGGSDDEAGDDTSAHGQLRTIPRRGRPAFSRSVTSMNGRPQATDPMAWLLTVDRLERPQLLFGDDCRPTHCFLAMMLNGSSANVLLDLANPNA